MVKRLNVRLMRYKDKIFYSVLGVIVAELIAYLVMAT